MVPCSVRGLVLMLAEVSMAKLKPGFAESTAIQVAFAQGDTRRDAPVRTMLRRGLGGCLWLLRYGGGEIDEHGLFAVGFGCGVLVDFVVVRHFSGGIHELPRLHDGGLFAVDGIGCHGGFTLFGLRLGSLLDGEIACGQ